VRRPYVPTLVAVVSSSLNILLDVLLIFGLYGFPRWEVAGAAVATVISLGVQVVLLQAIFLNGRMNRQYGTRTAYAIDMVKIRELFRIGWPAGIQFFMDIFNWGIFTSFLVGRFGDIALASHNAAINFMHVSFMPAVGLNHAIAPIVGQWIGQGDIARAKARTYTATRLAIVYMFTCGLFFAVYGGELIHKCFSTNPEIVRMGHTLLIFAAVFQAFDAVNITVMGALRGAGDTRFMMVCMGIMGYLFFLPLAWTLAVILDWGAIGSWVGATVYIIVLSFILFARFHGERWRHIRIFTEDLAEAG
jgi:MATE family multidrug resistance protein